MENHEHHIDHKSISNKLPIIGVLAVVLVLSGLFFMDQPHAKYRISAEDMHAKAVKFEDVIRPDVLMNILYTQDTVLYRFIDLRSAQDYLNGHLPGAVNIPVNKILDKEYADVFNQDEFINVLYANDQCGACGPWMILEQLGYNNNMVLQGGYKFAKNYVMDKYSPMTGGFRDENAKYDFAEIMQKMSAGSGAAKTEAVEEPPVIINNNSAPKEEEGGC